MPSSQTATLDAATEANTISDLTNGAEPDNVAYVEVSGTYGTAVAAFQGSADGTNYANLMGVRLDTGGIEQTPTMTDNTTRQWKVDISGMRKFRFYLTSIVSGSIACQVNTLNVPGGVPINLQNALSGNQAISGTLIVTSAAAAAFAVGANGSTNPCFSVNAATASVATGVKVTGAAEAGGVALVVTSSGTNEALTIDAKGSGTLTLNGTATGQVTVGANLGITDAKNIVIATTTGTKIGTATTQKLAFYNSTPIVQPAANTDTTTGAAGGTNSVYLNTTFTGSGGTAAFTIGGVVTALKALGLLAA